jgi:geranylgeranyl diphosphate synthase type II
MGASIHADTCDLGRMHVKANEAKSEQGADAVSILTEWGNALNSYFQALPSRYAGAPPRILEAVQYSLMAGGKRLRPALVLECWRACAGDGEVAPAALASAAAMELVHTFSLVHDDLPAMDDDDLRRGRPTNHKVYGEATAILAGDAMVTMAFELLAVDCPPELVAALVKELAAATGPAGMIGGQVLDMDAAHPPANLDELRNLHRMKTGALLTASCRMGALAAGADGTKLASLDHFGRHLGLAFQIVDDLLDETATPEQLGKATQKDVAKGKMTYPRLIGMEASRREAEKNLAAAIESIHDFGATARGLRELARFVVARNV